MTMTSNIANQTSMTAEAPPAVQGVHPMIAKVLSGLYGYVDESILREYGANGVDATNAAGSDAHVEITLPDAFEHNLVIQDFGTGMSLYEAKTHWAAYLNSTKTDDPDFIGAIGAGAKAGFAVSSMILLETTKDGVTTSFNYTWFDGAGPQVVGEHVEETGKPNGTKITIPVDPSGDWEAAAQRAFMYMGSRVKVNGEVIADPRGDNPAVMHRMGYEESDLLEGSRVVMGGANFRVPQKLIDSVSEVIVPVSGRLGYVVIEAPNKSLEFTPSREDIKDTPANAKKIQQIITESYAVPINEQYLGETAWETYRNVRRSDGSGLKVDYITAEIRDHIEAVETILNDVTETHGLVGITYQNGARNTWSGKRISGGRGYYSGYRNTITDGIAQNMIGSDQMLFVHSPEDSIHRSPKVRAWILDQDQDHMVISVPDAQLFARIKSAGFATMEDAELRKYKPKNHIPSAKRTAIRYAAHDLYTPRVSWYDDEKYKMNPADIAAAYDAVHIVEYGYSTPRVDSLSEEQNIELFKNHFDGQRIALIYLSASASHDLAVERIGLPVVDVHEVVAKFNTEATQTIPQQYVEKLTLLNGLCGHYGMYFQDIDSLRQMVKLNDDEGSNGRQSKVAPILEMINVSDTVVELTGLEEPAEVTELRTVLEQLTATDWIQEMVDAVSQQQHVLSVEGRIALTIRNLGRRSADTVLSRAARSLYSEFSNRWGNAEERMKTISGMVVASAHKQLLADSAEDEAEHVA